MKSVALHNLGCKVNSYELDVIAQKLEEMGFFIVPFDEKADIYMVNTCTVTNIADRKSRQMLHQAKKRNPDAVVVALGCYVQTGMKQTLADRAVDLVIGNNRKKDAAAILTEYLKNRENDNEGAAEDSDRMSGKMPDKTLGGRSVVDIGRETVYEEMQLTRTAGHTRACVKIQDGCNQFCSYCIIPYARGRVRSRREEDILQEVRGLVSAGFREIVLTGIHVSSYGLDFDGAKKRTADEPFPHERLLHLLRELDRIEELARIRLSSLEPRIITPAFAAGLKEIEKLCHHFHLSLQSGCDETLARMNRRYTAGEYLEKVELLREIFTNPAVTTDVIVGFPGETDTEFEKTKAFLEMVNFYEMHVFPYSRRAGTAAAARKDQVPEEIRKQRSRILLTLAKKQSEAFRESYIGKDVEVLFEETKKVCGVSCQVGYTGEYIRAAKKTGENLSGKICVGRLTGSAKEDGVSGGKASENIMWFE